MKKTAWLVLLLGMSVSVPALAHERNALGHSAQELAESASRIHRVAERRGMPWLTEKSYALARAARHLKHDAKKGVHRKHLRKQFKRVARQFHQLNNAFENSPRLHHRPRMQRKFSYVKRAFRDTRHAMFSGSAYAYHRDHGRVRDYDHDRRHDDRSYDSRPWLKERSSHTDAGSHAHGNHRKNRTIY